MRVQIISDGVHQTKVIDMDSGTELLVTRIEWTQQAGEAAKCKLVLCPPIELRIETDAEFMCGKTAVEFCIWTDGREFPVCVDHARWAATILRTLGHNYNSRPAEPEDICTQKIQER